MHGAPTATAAVAVAVAARDGAGAGATRQFPIAAGSRGGAGVLARPAAEPGQEWGEEQQAEEDGPMKALMESMKKDAAKK